MERIKFDGARMLEDMAERGWTAGDLASRAKPPVAVSTVSRFLRGEFQTPPMAKRLAIALGYRSAKRYLIRRSEVVSG